MTRAKDSLLPLARGVGSCIPLKPAKLLGPGEYKLDEGDEASDRKVAARCLIGSAIALGLLQQDEAQALAIQWNHEADRAEWGLFDAIHPRCGDFMPGWERTSAAMRYADQPLDKSKGIVDRTDAAIAFIGANPGFLAPWEKALSLTISVWHSCNGL